MEGTVTELVLKEGENKLNQNSCKMDYEVIEGHENL